MYTYPVLFTKNLHCREESGLSRTGYLFGGLRNDLKRKAPWYWSDFKDALSSQCIASWIFLYFACLSPIITFGGLLAEATGKQQKIVFLINTKSKFFIFREQHGCYGIAGFRFCFRNGLRFLFRSTAHNIRINW